MKNLNSTIWGKVLITLIITLALLVSIQPKQGVCGDEDEKKAVITVPGTNPPGPGKPVSAPKQERMCKTAVVSMAKGRPAAKYFDDFVVLLPGFYKLLGPKGQALLDKKPKVVIGVPNQSTGKVQWFEGGAIKDDNVRRCLSSKPFRDIFEKFATGKTRPAKQDERAYFYSFISFEIKGKPVTVVQAKAPPGSLRTLLLLYVEDGKITIMDYLKEQKR